LPTEVFLSLWMWNDVQVVRGVAEEWGASGVAAKSKGQESGRQNENFK